MEKLRKIKNSTKKFVEDHKVGITVTATSAVWLWINRTALREHDNFLKEKGLFEEFYRPEE